MTTGTIIKNINIVNEGEITKADLLIENGLIRSIGNLSDLKNVNEIDGTGKYLFPGIIDGQVHFRDPGLTHKGDLYTESKAGIAGGVTSFIDMPNTVPNVLTMEILNHKYQIAHEKSLANFGFIAKSIADTANGFNRKLNALRLISVEFFSNSLNINIHYVRFRIKADGPNVLQNFLA